MIAGICHVKNEIDVIESVLRHTLAEGVEALFISDHMSTDGTWELLQEMERGLPIFYLSRDDLSVFYQEDQMNAAARLAEFAGADWIVPFDADEFFYAPSGRTVADELRDLPPSVDKLFCRSWRYLDLTRRETTPQRAKVVFRPSPGARLVAGNHDVTVPGGTWDVIEVAHYQYRSREQFGRKVAGLAAYEPLFAVQGRPPWLDMDQEALDAEWDKLCAVETEVAPIPIRVAAR